MYRNLRSNVAAMVSSFALRFPLAASLTLWPRRPKFPSLTSCLGLRITRSPVHLRASGLEHVSIIGLPKLK